MSIVVDDTFATEVASDCVLENGSNVVVSIFVVEESSNVVFSDESETPVVRFSEKEDVCGDVVVCSDESESDVLILLKVDDF